jgi:hypothetical protein
MTEEEKQQYKRYFTSGDEMYNPEEGTKQLEEFFKRKAAIQQLGGYLNLQDMTDYSGLFFTLICFVISLVVIERVVIPSKYSMYEYSIPIFFAITYTSLLGIITIAGGIDRNMFMTHITSMIIILVLMFLLWKHKCTPNYGVALLFAWLVSLWWSVMIASIR